MPVALRWTAFLPFITLIFATCSCSEPFKEYDYKAFSVSKGWSEDTCAVFHLDINDSLKKSSLMICAQIINNVEISRVGSLPVRIVLTSPAGRVFTDNIELPLNVVQVRGILNQKGMVMEIEWPYFKDFLPCERGRWRIEMRHSLENRVPYKNIIGLGVSYRR